MSLNIRIKQFRISNKCKGEKIARVEFRGKVDQH